MAHAGQTALEIVDSPGSNEALSPRINEKWAEAIAHSDIVVLVVAYSQLETKDVADFWTSTPEITKPGVIAQPPRVREQVRPGRFKQRIRRRGREN